MQAEARRYHVLGLLGRGGFGTVYRAELQGAGGFSKLVALKILNPEVVDSDDVTRRLRDEARVLGLLRHRAIVQVDGLVQLSGRWTVVMEYVDGVDLRRLLAARGPLPVAAAVEVVEEVASALAAAWEAKGADGRPLRLLHRDIKPANVHLTPNAEVKVLDFGIAKAEFEGREARTHQMTYGSLPYMAPERLDGTDAHEGDVYALGVTMCELLTGRSWDRPSVSEDKHDKRLHEVYAAVRARTRDAAKSDVDELCFLIGDMLAFEPEDRIGADEVRRRCRKLVRASADVPLADYAREVVPGLVAEQGPPGPDDLSGSILVEGHTASEVVVDGLPSLPRPVETSTATRSVARRAGWAALAALTAALAAVVVVGLGVGAGAWWLRPAEVPAAIEVAPPPPPPRPRPRDTGTPAPKPVAPAPAPAPEPPPKPAPAPRPKPTTVRVEVVGASSAALLVDGAAVALPASVKPGTYDVQADFGRGAVPAGRVTVPSSGAPTLSCDGGFRLCTLK